MQKSIFHTSRKLQTRSRKNVHAVTAVRCALLLAAGAGLIAGPGSAFAEADKAYAAGDGASANSTKSTALGANSSATGISSLAIGGATADGSYTIAIGDSAKALETGSHPYDSSVAIGYKAFADGERALALGSSSKATGMDSIGIGFNNPGQGATGTNAISIGVQSTASGSASVTLGQHSTASGSLSIAIGDAANAAGDYSHAMGYLSTASASSAIAMGNQAEATSNNAVSLGEQAKAAGGNSTALGAEANAGGFSSIAAGYQSAASGSFSLALGQQSVASGASSQALGYNATASGEGSLAISQSSQASGYYSQAIGYGTKAEGAYAMATGLSSQATGDFSQASGYQAKAAGYSSLALGTQASASGGWSQAIGMNASASGDYSQALGLSASSSSQGGVALGYGSVADRESGAEGWKPDWAEVDSGASRAWVSGTGALSVGAAAGQSGSGITRQIINVSAGSEDTDAVNLAQLKAVASEIVAGSNTTVTHARADDGHTIWTISATGTKVTGGAVTYAANGAGTLTLENSDQSSVEVTGLQDSFTTKAELAGNTLTFTRNDGGTYSVGGIASTGDISSIRNEINANTTRIDGLDQRVNRLDKDIDKAGASAAALAALHPLDFDPDHRFMVSAGFGHYKTRSGVAVGAFWYPTDTGNLLLSAGYASSASDSHMVNAGLTYRFGGDFRHAVDYREIALREQRRSGDLEARLGASQSREESLAKHTARLESELNAVKAQLSELRALVMKNAR